MAHGSGRTEDDASVRDDPHRSGSTKSAGDGNGSLHDSGGHGPNGGASTDVPGGEENAERQAANGLTAHYPEFRNHVKNVKLYEVLQEVWFGRKLVIKVAALIVGCGLLFVLGSRSEYESGATLLPEQQKDQPLTMGMGLMQQFGGLLGVSPGALTGSGTSIPPQLYPDILRSLPLQKELLSTNVNVPGESQPVTLETYLSEMKPFSLWEVPSSLVRLVSGADPVSGGLHDSAVVQLSRQERLLIADLRERIGGEIDKKTGVLHVSVLMPDPIVAAQVAESAVEQLQSYVTRYRLEKLNQELAFVDQRYEEARQSFMGAQTELARFRDRNKNLAMNVAQAEEQRLRAEYDVAFNVYNTLATRREEAKIKVHEETPVFQVLEPVTVPSKRARPKAAMVLLLCVIVGVVAGGTAAVLKEDILRFKAVFRR